MWIYPAHLGILISGGLPVLCPCLGGELSLLFYSLCFEGRIVGAFFFLTLLH